MWKGLRQLLARLWRRSQKSSAERRVAEERARFWAEVREGQREAEAHSRS
jgi:chromosome condensin MukBEF MukE localization factor